MKDKIAVITGSSKHFSCRSCGMKFDKLGDMQKTLNNRTSSEMGCSLIWPFRFFVPLRR